jgi:hypothetical protein
MKDWVKMPTKWILNKENPPLVGFQWKGNDKSAHISAIMLYLTISHHVNDTPNRQFPEIGHAKLSFTELMDITDISRAKVAEGLSVLTAKGLIEKIVTDKTNIYRIYNYGVGSWGKLPAKLLYDKSMKYIMAFKHFNLRIKNELNALKLYLLLVAFRNNDTNYATISYKTITYYTGIHRNEIKSAISLLINIKFIQLDKTSSEMDPDKTVNLYRIVGIDRYRHSGTMSEEQFSELLPSPD